jgi:hypothetical protein
MKIAAGHPSGNEHFEVTSRFFFFLFVRPYSALTAPVMRSTLAFGTQRLLQRLEGSSNTAICVTAIVSTICKFKSSYGKQHKPTAR